MFKVKTYMDGTLQGEAMMDSGETMSIDVTSNFEGGRGYFIQQIAVVVEDLERSILPELNEAFEG